MKLHEAGITAGWAAALELQYARQLGRTALIHRQHSGPLRVQKTLYPEGPGICHTIVLHPPGGIVGGDSLRMDIGMQAHSRVLLTSPGATKWYRSAGATASQHLSFSVAEGAVLEWLPQETILFNGARATMRTEVCLADNALFIGWEITCLGRVASGERFAQGICDQQIEIYKNGQPILHEHGILSGGDRLLQSPIGLAGNTVTATLWVAGASVPEEILEQCRGLGLQGPRPAKFGVTQLPELLVVRYLGQSAEQVRWLFEAAWDVLRPALAGCPACPPRIWKT